MSKEKILTINDFLNADINLANIKLFNQALIPRSKKRLDLADAQSKTALQYPMESINPKI